MIGLDDTEVHSKAAAGLEYCSHTQIMKLLIIGATGGTGKQLVQQALSRGHTVTAFARTPSKIKERHSNLSVVRGDVLDYKSVLDAVKGHEAVLCALGHRKWIIKTSILSEGTRNIIWAMESHGVKRLICQTSLGVGDSRGRLGLYYTLFVIPFIVYFYYRDKERQEQLIRQSTLNWTIVRPAAFRPGRRRGIYGHGPEIGHRVLTLRITRADTADFMLNQLTDDTYLHQTPAIAY